MAHDIDRDDSGSRYASRIRARAAAWKVRNGSGHFMQAGWTGGDGEMPRDCESRRAGGTTHRRHLRLSRSQVKTI
jgi:hypothetical protein